MDAARRIAEEIARLDEAIGASPADHLLYMERGKLHHRSGDFSSAMNDFIRVTELDAANAEAEGYIAFLGDIFAFRYAETYNP